MYNVLLGAAAAQQSSSSSNMRRQRISMCYSTEAREAVETAYNVSNTYFFHATHRMLLQRVQCRLHCVSLLRLVHECSVLLLVAVTCVRAVNL
jgi:hypothetical protein